MKILHQKVKAKKLYLHYFYKDKTKIVNKTYHVHSVFHAKKLYQLA